MLKIIALIIAVAIVAVIAFAATKPDTFSVVRKVSIKATPDKIFPYFNDLHKNLEWSPYEKKDPAMKRTFTGAESGKGAVYAFEGNSQVGAGRIEITDTVEPTKVVMTLDMIKPISGHNIVTYTLEPKGESTDVTWAMDGASPLIAKVMGLFFSMDKMIGNDFDAGLVNLKAIVEAGDLK